MKCINRRCRVYDKAKKAGLVSSVEDLKNLSLDEWKRVLTLYNGKKIYGEKTSEYFPYIREYLK